MKNIFAFHGVGQGLFYSGSLFEGKFNFVYDCGSESQKEPLCKSIEKLHRGLDFVVISHLHNDHINGLPKLLEQVNVKKIFLPYFDTKAHKDVFVATLIASGILPQTPTFTLILKLYKVTIDLDDSVLSESSLANIEKAEIVPLQNELETNNFYKKWCFRFYNRKINDELYDKLEAKLKEIVGERSIEQYIMDSNGNFNELRDEFKKIYSNQNMTSILLMHWDPLNPKQKTLLTGDVKFDIDLAKRVCNDIKDKDEITLQVPHHGATAEWQFVPKCIEGKSTAIVLSFGLTNGYHHPSLKKMADYYESFDLSKRIKFVYDHNTYSYYID